VASPMAWALLGLCWGPAVKSGWPMSRQFLARVEANEASYVEIPADPLSLEPLVSEMLSLLVIYYYLKV
jgi:hypothetical protein